MRTNFYTYCILKYKHSPFLDESLNIGVLIYFEGSQRFVFRYSKTLNRVKSIYNNVPEKTIKEYIRQIDRHLEIYQSKYKNYVNLFPLNDLSLKSFLSQYFLSNDSTVLQFSNFKTDELRGFDEEFIENIILEQVFIDDLRPHTYHQQEPKILSKLINNLKDKGLNNYRHKNNLYNEDYTLTNETGTEFKFDIAWQNGTLNLVKPIGFDLKESISIANKAHKNFGQFYDLQSEAEKKNLSYDLILGRPTNSNLNKDFEHAVKLLKQVKNTRIIFEEDLDNYSKDVIKAISK